MTKTQRSYCMSRVKSKDTSLERLVRSALHRRGRRFFKHCRHLPGSPDLVFPTRKVAVFLDGDFWHGYRFPDWAGRLKPYWRQKIAGNRRRDRRNARRLRAMGWRVVRIWEHEARRDLEGCVERVERAVAADYVPH